MSFTLHVFGNIREFVEVCYETEWNDWDLCSHKLRSLTVENTQGVDEPYYIILNILPLDINIKYRKFVILYSEMNFTAVHLSDWVYIVVIWYVFPISDLKSEKYLNTEEFSEAMLVKNMF